MKDWHIVIIGIGLITGGMFLLSSIFTVVFFIGFIKLIATLAVLAAIGFIVVRYPPIPFKNNMHTAILVPWLPTMLAVFICILLGYCC